MYEAVPSDLIFRPVELNEVASKVKPPIAPLVAVNAPATDTLNGASANAVAPAQKPPDDCISTRVAPVPAYNSVAVMVKPPIAPAVAVIVPVIVAYAEVRAPAAVTRKSAVARLAKVLPPQNTMSVPAFAEFRPPAVAPVPTVMFAALAAPLVNVIFVAESVVGASVQPPIEPLVEVIEPVNDALPLASSWMFVVVLCPMRTPLVGSIFTHAAVGTPNAQP